MSSFFLQRDLQAGCADLLKQAKARGLTVSLDPSWDPDEAWDAGIEAVYGFVDLLFVNRDEAKALGVDPDWRRAAARLATRVPLLVVKGGPEGASIIRGDGWQDYRGFSVEAVDPTGAGDAFNAGFLFGYLAGRPLADCATWANACGAMTVGQPGGSGAFKSREDVEGFIQLKRGIGD
jgi:sugar/nucleoside kinase (ribokinase family)